MNVDQYFSFVGKEKRPVITKDPIISKVKEIFLKIVCYKVEKYIKVMNADQYFSFAGKEKRPVITMDPIISKVEEIFLKIVGTIP